MKAAQRDLQNIDNNTQIAGCPAHTLDKLSGLLYLYIFFNIYFYYLFFIYFVI